MSIKTDLPPGVMLALATGRKDIARNSLIRAVKSEPANTFSWLCLAVTLPREQAIQALQRALVLEPDNEAALRNLLRLRHNSDPAFSLELSDIWQLEQVEEDVPALFGNEEPTLNLHAPEREAAFGDETPTICDVSHPLSNFSTILKAVNQLPPLPADSSSKAPSRSPEPIEALKAPDPFPPLSAFVAPRSTAVATPITPTLKLTEPALKEPVKRSFNKWPFQPMIQVAELEDQAQGRDYLNTPSVQSPPKTARSKIAPVAEMAFAAPIPLIEPGSRTPSSRRNGAKPARPLAPLISSEGLLSSDERSDLILRSAGAADSGGSTFKPNQQPRPNQVDMPRLYNGPRPTLGMSPRPVFGFTTFGLLIALLFILIVILCVMYAASGIKTVTPAEIPTPVGALFNLL